MGNVYIISNEDGVCKVGEATCAESRLRTLQTANPQELEIDAKIKSSYSGQIERHLHILLDEYQVRGEWFDLPSHVLEGLRELADNLNGSKVEEEYRNIHKAKDKVKEVVEESVNHE